MTKFCLVPTYYLYQDNPKVLYKWYPPDKMLYQLQFYIPPGTRTENVYLGKLLIGTREAPNNILHKWSPCEGWSIQQIKDRVYGFKQIEVEIAEKLFPSVELE